MLICLERCHQRFFEKRKYHLVKRLNLNSPMFILVSRFLILGKIVLWMAIFTQFSTAAFGQSIGEPMTLGTVPAKDLQMMTYEPDTSAAAVVLCDFGKITVEELSNEYKCRYYRHRRVKILKESGFDYGDVELIYYSKNKREQMGRIKANIFAPDGTIHTLSKKDFFEEEGEYVTKVKFAFPNVQVGSVIEYKYTVMHDGIYLLPEWYFQEDIPIRWNELQFDFLDKFSYTYLFEGNPGMVKREEGDVTYLEGELGQMTLKDRQFIMENSVAMKEEPYITTMDDYKARVRFQLDSYIDGYGVKQQVLSSWTEIIKDLESQPFFGPQYMRKKFTKEANEALQPRLIGLTSEEEKVQAIYDFIAENIEWNGRYSDFASKDLSKVWEEKKGYSAELNFIFISLLRQNGFEAYPLMTSTRDHGKMYENYPILSQFDHTMVWTKIDGKDRILDVPTKTRPMRLPTISALNNRGVVIKKPEAFWVDIDAKMGTDAFVYEVALDAEGTLSGTVDTRYVGYNARPERRAYMEKKDGQHWTERFEDFTEVDVELIETEDLENINKPFKEKLKLTIPEAATVAGDFIYFSPIIYSNFKENELKLEKRFFPVDMAYPIQEQMVMKLTIPEGYSIEELPEVANLALPNNAGKFRYAVSEKDEKTIQLIATFKLNQYQFDPMEYPSLREMFDLVAEKYGEQIVLKRK